MPTDGTPDPGFDEYGNYMDAMGRVDALNGRDFNVYEKAHVLKWLPTGTFNDLNGADRVSGDYPILPMDDSTARNSEAPIGSGFGVGAKYGIRIQGEKHSYWVEFRQHAAWQGNAFVTDGVSVVREGPLLLTSLLDTTPLTSDARDASLMRGRTFTEETEGVHITPLRKENGAMVVRVRFFEGTNAPPATATVTARVGTAAPVERTIEVSRDTTVTLSAALADSDNDDLVYSWDFGDGTFSAGVALYDLANPGPRTVTVSKSWSAFNHYRVRLVVSDAKGKTAASSVTVRVPNPAQSPLNRISGRVLDPLGNGIQGVRVTHGTTAGYTDSDGTYTLSLPADAAAAPVTATKVGWDFSARGFSNPVLPGPDTVGVDFRATGAERLYKLEGYVSGLVQYEEGPPQNEPIPNVRIEDHLGRVTGTDATGNYTLYVPNGTYRLTYSYPGVSVMTGTVRVFFADVPSGQNMVPLGTVVKAGGNTPSVMTSAMAEPMAPGQAGVWLNASATDDDLLEAIRYEWKEVSGLRQYVQFERSANTNAAKRMLATFSRAGTYVLRGAIVADADGSYTFPDSGPDSRSRDVIVTVGATLSHVRVTPAGERVRTEGSKQFTATPLDQFGEPMSGAVTWPATSSGSITQDGLFTAPTSAGRVSIKADAGGGVVGGATADVRTPAVVSARHVAYGNSGFGAAAVAPDKVPLLPGQGIAKFANYTSYAKGINCIIVDLDGPWPDVTAGDFSFLAGNFADRGSWVGAPTPGVRVERVGLTSTRRVYLTWPDYDPATPNSTVNAVANKWLQVTVLATDRTGLTSPDVFYFGNLIGDTGNDTGGAGDAYATLADDYGATKAVADDVDQEIAFLDSHYDHNRNGIHDEEDYLLVEQNFFRTLYLITA